MIFDNTKIREAREAAGLSVEKLAELARTDPGGLSRIENGKRVPNVTTLGKLAQALGRNPDFFFRPVTLPEVRQ